MRTSRPPWSAIVGLLAILVGLVVGSASAQMITADGVAAITGNPAIARAKAIDDALRRAVEQTVGTFVSSDTLTKNYQVVHDKILAQTSGFVKRYEIVAEKREGQEYRVTVAADIGRDNLQQSLEALGLLHEFKEKPKVMVVMTEKVSGLYGTTGWETVGQAESTLIEKLLAGGFTVVDPQQVRSNIPMDRALRMLEGDLKAAAVAGLQHNAQVVITGQAISKFAGPKLLGTSMQSIQASVVARALRTDDARLIGSRSAQAAKAHLDEMQGGVLAIREATREVADGLVADLVNTWKREVYGRSQQITLVISGLVSYRHLTAIKQFLETELEGMKAVHQRNFTQGLAELALDYAGKSTVVANELVQKQFVGFRLEPTNVTPNRLDVRAVVER